jgi:hypothetical protein
MSVPTGLLEDGKTCVPNTWYHCHTQSLQKSHPSDTETYLPRAKKNMQTAEKQLATGSLSALKMNASSMSPVNMSSVTCSTGGPAAGAKP